MSTASRRVVVITGASAGVGRASARAFAQRGYDVCLIARGRAGLDAARREVEAVGARATTIQADVADAQQMIAAADRAESGLGPIDVWVNAAMVSMFAPFWETDDADFRRVTDVTYLGVVNGTRAALRPMRRRDHGVIVQIGSVVTYRAIPLQSPYSGAKAAVQGFTDALRSELLHEGSSVRLTTVHMPALNTPYYRWARNQLPKAAQPPPPAYEPELAADAVVWAAENPRREVFVTSSVVAGVYGQRLAPGLADRAAALLWELQQSDEARGNPPNDAERRDNMYAPLDDDRDWGAHGGFGARRHSAYFWMEKHRRPLAVVAGAAALVATAALRRGGNGNAKGDGSGGG